MLAAFAESQSFDEPLGGLRVDQRPEPEAGEGWEILEVRAAALNHHDLWALRGIGLEADRLPMILGADAAGVTADGREVIAYGLIADGEGWTLLSELHPGTLAERVAVPSANLLDKPADLSFEEAACLPTAWLTAYRMLFGRGELRPGQRVLVQGAGGGVATALIALASAAGVEVTATSRSDERLERSRELGAATLVRSGERVPARVDAVMETVGEATWAHSLRSLRPGGRIVVSGSTTGPNPPSELQRVFIREIDVRGSSMGSLAELEELIRMMALTGTRPVIDSVRPLSDAAGAFERMRSGEEWGKLVVAP